MHLINNKSRWNVQQQIGEGAHDKEERESGKEGRELYRMFPTWSFKEGKTFSTIWELIQKVSEQFVNNNPV